MICEKPIPVFITAPQARAFAPGAKADWCTVCSGFHPRVKAIIAAPAVPPAPAEEEPSEPSGEPPVVSYCQVSGKRCFAGHGSAKKFAARFRTGGRQRAYRCDDCGKWHLTTAKMHGRR